MFKKWPLWLKWGVGFLVFDIAILVFDIIRGSELDWEFLGGKYPVIFSYFNLPALLIPILLGYESSLLESDYIPYVSEWLLILLGFIIYFWVGSVYGFIVQKIKDHKIKSGGV